MADGAAIGAIAGAFISAYPAMSEGGGGGAGGNSLAWVGAGTLLGGIIGGSLGYLAARKSPAPFENLPKCLGYSLLNPCARQVDLQVGNLWGFTGPGSLVNVREFETNGTGLGFSEMGMNTQQMPTLDLRYLLNSLDAIHFRFRYFNIGGTSFSSKPIAFNGAIIPGGRTNNFDPWEWFSFSLYFERRLTPFYYRYQTNWPAVLQNWDLRLRLGIEYTYLNFEINGGSTPTHLAPGGEETAEDFYHQSMPLPTIGLEAYRQLRGGLLFNGEIEGNWINRWNSLRSEGGTVWASQSGAEAHLRLYYSHPSWFGPIKPMAGFFFYYSSQLEDSHEDGNYIHWSSYGPEIGIALSF
ncbi:MAG: hypothetical protein JO166_12920 [Deltaproteobacteria bacterium]|nr:hypothetical protein [Deltaproteobacteria bacterium]